MQTVSAPHPGVCPEANTKSFFGTPARLVNQSSPQPTIDG